MERYQKILQFENGYGLSIISHQFSYGGKDGLFEAALLDDQGMIMYDPERNWADVRGWLDFSDVVELIELVKGYSPK